MTLAGPTINKLRIFYGVFCLGLRWRGSFFRTLTEEQAQSYKDYSPLAVLSAVNTQASSSKKGIKSLKDKCEEAP